MKLRQNTYIGKDNQKNNPTLLFNLNWIIHTKKTITIFFNRVQIQASISRYCDSLEALVSNMLIKK